METSTTIATTSISSNPEPVQDNFHTPANQKFYINNPYSNLDSTRRDLKLLAPFSLSSDEPPKYCAISYFAGNHKETEAIYVNAIEFSAFANLARALRQVANARKRGNLDYRPNLIWADQICINQSSPMEGSHQVGFMRSIYESAEVVFACLGWDDPSAGRWVQAAMRLDLAGPFDLELRGSLMYHNNNAIADFYDEEFRKDWDALRNVLGSNWWQRGWVHQEYVCAREAVIFFGNELLDVSDFEIPAQVFKSISSDFVRYLIWTGKPMFDEPEWSFKVVSDLSAEYSRFMIDG